MLAGTLTLCHHVVFDLHVVSVLDAAASAVASPHTMRFPLFDTFFVCDYVAPVHKFSKTYDHRETRRHSPVQSSLAVDLRKRLYTVDILNISELILAPCMTFL